MKKLYLFAISLSALVFIGAGCFSEPGTSSIEQTLTEENQTRLLKNQPPVKLEWSLERDNINKRTELWNDPNKVSYIYLTEYGRIMAFYTINGKVSSVNSQITNPEQLAHDVYQFAGNNLIEGVLPSPAEDGSYGTNGNAIFFFTTDGVYVEWNGTYMLVDEPLQLTSQPQLIREIE